MAINDRATPMVRIRVTLPGRKAPERVDLDELLVDEGLARITPGARVGSRISRILRFSYEDTEKGADKAKFDLNNYDLRFPDDPIFDRGNLIYVTWGYAGNMAPEREMVVIDWVPGPKFSIEAQFKAATAANQIPVDETYYGRTYAEIAELIAERNGFGVSARFIEPVPFRPESVVQDNLTDAQFMRKLAKEIGYVFFVDISGWHFHPVAYGQRPRKVLEYFPNEPNDLLEFPAFDKAPAAQPGNVKVQAVDPVTKKPISAEGNNATTAGRPGLAKEVEVIDRRTATTALRPLAARETVTTTTAGSPEEAKAKSGGLFKKAAGVPVKCTAPCQGDPGFQAKSIVDLRRIGQRLSGLYYCSAATHTVEPGKYTMALKLQRDGTNGTGAGVGAAPSAAKTNTQKAPASVAAGGSPPLEPFEKINAVTAQTTTAFRQQGPTK